MKYLGELRRRRRNERYVKLTGNQIGRLFEGVASVGRMTPERTRQALGRIHASGRTVNSYRVALHGFFAWLVREGRWSVNPVDHVAPVREVKKKIRRALTLAEMRRLLEAAPKDRALVYLVAATTGLRRGELAALTWGDVDLERATVTVRAASAKNRKDAVQPIPPETVEGLRRVRRNQAAKTPVFPSRPRKPGIPSVIRLREDLAKAEIPEETGEGVLDFHALRVTYGTELARAGVPLALAQRLMRHSTPVLTSNVYSKLELKDGAEAVAKIQLLPPSGV